jgi:hypothetical protein
MLTAWLRQSKLFQPLWCAPNSFNLSVFIDRTAAGVPLKWSSSFFFVLPVFYYYTDMFSRVSPLMSSLRLCSAILYPEIELWKPACAVYIPLISSFVYVRYSKPHRALLWSLLCRASVRMLFVILQFRKAVAIFQVCFYITVQPMAVIAG